MASIAEIEIGLVGQASKTGLAYTEDWSFASKPGSAIKLARAESKNLDPDQANALTALIDEFTRLSTVRHRAVHGVLVLDPTLDRQVQWAVKSMRGGVVQIDELTTAMAEARAALQDVGARANRLRVAVAVRKRAPSTD